MVTLYAGDRIIIKKTFGCVRVEFNTKRNFVRSKSRYVSFKKKFNDIARILTVLRTLRNLISNEKYFLKSYKTGTSF